MSFTIIKKKSVFLSYSVHKWKKKISGPLKMIFNWAVFPSWIVNPKKFEIGQANARNDNKQCTENRNTARTCSSLVLDEKSNFF